MNSIIEDVESDGERKSRMKRYEIKFKLNNPGWLMEFEGQAEVGELIQRPEISDLIFRFSKDYCLQ
jgi:hypothetical protein